MDTVITVKVAWPSFYLIQFLSNCISNVAPFQNKFSFGQLGQVNSHLGRIWRSAYPYGLRSDGRNDGRKFFTWFGLHLYRLASANPSLFVKQFAFFNASFPIITWWRATGGTVATLWVRFVHLKYECAFGRVQDGQVVRLLTEKALFLLMILRSSITSVSSNR